MSRRDKGARLWLQPERRKADGSLKEAAAYLILDTIDGKRHVERTGCGADARDDAEKELSRYIAQKHVNTIVNTTTVRRSEEIKIAEVLALYLTKKVPSQAKPKAAQQRIGRLNKWWGHRFLSEVNGATCDQYAAICTTKSVARQELSDLRAAINFYRKQGLCREVIVVSLPEKAKPRERWLTHDEAAAILWQAWSYREKQNWSGSDRRTRRHVAKFILVACYTGTRSGAICNASFDKQPGRGWIDLEKGVFYRRAAGEVETKKRKPPIKLPPRLLAHMRRWHKNGARYVVEWQGRPIKNLLKAFHAAAEAAGLGREVIPHILRHTAATWGMQAGADPWQLAGYLGMTVDMLIRNYGHHHPNQYESVHEALERRNRRTA